MPVSRTERARGDFQSSLGIKKECTLCRVERDGLALGFAVVIVARRRRTRVLPIGLLIGGRLKRSAENKGSADRCGRSDRGYAHERRRDKRQRNLQLSSKNRQSTASIIPADRSFPVGHANRIFGGEP